MSEITLSKAVRSNLLNLQSTADLLGKSQERLSTGLRVNSALDNPTNFFTAQGLNSRANDLSQLLDSVSNAVQTVAAADKGITAITKLVESAQATARQALQTSATVAATSAITASVTSGNTTSVTITGNTAANIATRSTGNLTGFSASSGSSVNLAVASTGNLTGFTASSGSPGTPLSLANVSTGNLTGFVASSGSPADSATLVQNAYTPVDLSNANTLTFDLTVDGTTTSISLDNTITAVDNTAVTGQELADAINLQLGGGTVATFDSGNGNLVFTSSTTSSTSDVSVATVAGTAAANSGIVSGSDLGADLVADTTGTFTINGASVTIANGESLATIIGNLNTAAGTTSGSNAFTVSNSSGTLTITGTAGNDVTIAGLTADQQTAFGLSNTTTNGDAFVASTPDTTGTFTINGASVTIANGESLATIVSNLQTAAGTTSGSSAFTVSNSSGTLSITGTAGNDVTIAGLTAAQQTAFGLSNTTTNGDAAVADTTGTFTINGASVTIANGESLATIVSNLNTAAGTTSGTNAFTVSNSSGTLTISGTAGNDVTIAGLTAAQQTAFGLSNTTTNGDPAVTGTAGSFTINGQNVTLAASDNAAAILSKIQTAATGSGSGANAFTVSNSSGVLTLTGTAGNDVVIAGLTSQQTTALGLSNGTTDGTPAGSAGPNPKRAELVETYNDLLGQIDALAKDSGFNGVNLLNGDDLSVLFNEDGTSSLSIAGIDDDAAGLGLTAIASTAFDTNVSINSTLDDLKGAIETLRGQSAKFGSNLSVVETRQDFTKNMINVLQTGASNLTLADTNEEAANVLALQTRQQLSSTALSLASQADQNVLRLF